MTPANSSAVLEQDRQFEQLTAEIVGKLEKFGASFKDLDERVQKQFAEHVQEISKLGDRLVSVDHALRARFESHERNPRGARAICASAGLRTEQQISAFADMVLALGAKENIGGARRGGEESGLLHRAAAGESTGPAGSFLLEEQMATELLSNLETYGLIEGLVPIVPTGGDVLSALRLTGGATLYYPDLGVDATLSDISFGLSDVRPVHYTVAVAIDRYMARSKPALAAIVIEEMRRTLSQGQDVNVLAGDGTKTYARTLGMFNRATADTGRVTVSGATGDDTYKEVFAKGYDYATQVMGSLSETASRDASISWTMHRSMFFGFLGATDSTGQRLAVANIEQGGRKTILGDPVNTSAACPTKLSDASQADKCMAVYGPVRRAWRGARNVAGVELQQFNEVKGLANQIVFVLRVLQAFDEVDPTQLVQLRTHS